MLRALIAIGTLALAVTASFAAEPDLDDVIEQADLALQAIQNDPDAAIPREVLAEAEGVIIWPEASSLHVVVGGGARTGVLLRRADDRSWEKPKFVRQKVGSVGLQAGYESGSKFEIFLTRKRLDAFIKTGSLLVGGGASIQLRKKKTGRKDFNLQNQDPNGVVETYSLGKKVTTGIKLVGDYKKVDPRLEAAYYAEAESLPAAAARLLSNLRGYGEASANDAIVVSDEPQTIRAAALMPLDPKSP
jgi:lipid-binding SYLF domain-containing protein